MQGYLRGYKVIGAKEITIEDQNGVLVMVVGTSDLDKSDPEVGVRSICWYRLEPFEYILASSVD